MRYYKAFQKNQNQSSHQSPQSTRIEHTLPGCHLKLTQEQVAELVCMETQSKSNIENGKYFPIIENLDQIMNMLGVRPSEIFFFESLAPKDELIQEMYDAMKNDEKLARLMYKFYLSVKYQPIPLSWRAKFPAGCKYSSLRNQCSP